MELVISRRKEKILRIRTDKGKRHDFKIYKEKPLTIGRNKEILADKGYQGIQKIHEKADVPYKRRRGQKLSKEQKKFNHRLSSDRIAVEHMIRRLKIFRILSCRYRNRRKRFGLRVNLIASIVNMLLS